MPDEFELDFTAVSKPTIDQVRYVWFSMPSPTVRKVADELQKRGAKISFKTVARYKADGWVAGPKVSTRDAKSIVGSALSAPELVTLEQDIATLSGMTVKELVEAQEKARLIFNTAILRCATRKADVLAIIPRDAAALMVGATEAVQATAPLAPLDLPAHTNGIGNGHMIDITPSNPLQDAIAAFKRRAGVAA